MTNHRIRRVFSRRDIFFACIVFALFPFFLFGGDPIPFETYYRIDTPHFTFLAEENDVPVIRMLAGGAESVYTNVTTLLDVDAFGRTTVIITDTDDSANGYATSYPGNMIVIYRTSPNDIFYNDMEGWARNVFIHEFTHIVHFNTGKGVNKAIRSIPGILYNALIVSPTWYVEGLAMHTETKYGARGRERDVAIEQMVALTAKATNFPSYGVASTIRHTFPFGATRYYYGTRFVVYLTECFGTNAIPRLHNAHAKRLPMIPPFYAGFESAFKETFGVSGETLWYMFQTDERTKAIALADAFAGEGGSVATNYHETRGRVTSYACAPGGNALFLSTYDEHNGVKNIALSKNDASPSRAYKAGTSLRSLTFTDDATVAYLRYRVRSVTRNYLVPYTLSLTTGEETRIPIPSTYRLSQLASRSGDRGYVALAGGGENALFLFRADGTHITTHALPETWTAIHHLRVGREHALFAVNDEEGRNFLVRISLATGSYTRYTVAGSKIYHPAFGDNDDTVYLVLDGEGGLFVYRADLASLYLTRVVASGDLHLMPTVVRDTLRVIRFDGKTHRLLALTNVSAHETDLALTTLDAVSPSAHSDSDTPLPPRYRARFHGHWLPFAYTLDSIFFSPNFTIGAQGVVADAVGRHAFYPTFSYDIYNGLFAGSFWYVNRATPVALAFHAGTYVSYYGTLLAGTNVIDDIRDTLTGARTVAYQYRHMGSISCTLPFYIFEDVYHELGLAAEVAYFPKTHTALPSFMYERTRAWENRIHLSFFATHTKATPLALRAEEGATFAFRLSYYPRFALNPEDLFRAQTSFSFYFTPFAHVSFSLAGRATFSSESALFGGPWANTNSADTNAPSILSYDTALYNNSVGATLSVWFPIAYAYREVVVSYIFVERMWGALTYDVSDAFASRDDFTLSHRIIAEVFFDLSLYYTAAPLRMRLGVTYRPDVPFSFDAFDFSASFTSRL